MSKFFKTKTPLILVALLLVLFNVIFWVSVKPAEANATVWVGYAFLTLAIIILGAMTFIFKLKSDTTMTTLVAVLYLAMGYFAVAFILNLILMLVNGEKATAGIILNVIVLILFIAVFVILYRSFSRVQDNTAAREKRMRELRMTGVKVSGLTYLTTDQEIIAAIRKFKDDIDNSSSRGNENTQAIEEQLDQQIDIIRTLLTNGADNEAVLRALRGAEGLLKQRNQLLIIR
ncbi:MAG: hypothetical protein IKL77_04485 [Clostridia bacterium]|nr:hypothetical protein [Clostridia bacterium]